MLFALHFPLLEMVKKAFASMVGTQTVWQVLPAIVLVPIFTMAISLAIAKVIKEYWPGCYSFITGGR
jgi:phosphate/sulfate permease